MEGGNGFESFGWVYVNFHYLQFLSGEKASNPVKTIMTEKDANLAILLVTLLGWFSDPFKWLSDRSSLVPFARDHCLLHRSSSWWDQPCSFVGIFAEFHRSWFRLEI